MPEPRFSVIVPTIGRPSLADSLVSCDSVFVDEILVSPDGRQAHTACEQIVAETPLLYPSVTLLDPIDESRLNERGHPQRNRAMLQADSPWLCFLDDDDTFVHGAFARIVGALGPDVPHIFRMRYTEGHPEAGTVLWGDRELRECNVGTPMFVVPNRRLGWWPSRIMGDFHFIRETCGLQGEPVFVDEVIASVGAPS